MQLSAVLKKRVDNFELALEGSVKTIPEGDAAEEVENVEAWGCGYAKVLVRDYTLDLGC
jgi:hypothetical protein